MLGTYNGTTLQALALTFDYAAFNSYSTEGDDYLVVKWRYGSGSPNHASSYETLADILLSSTTLASNPEIDFSVLAGSDIDLEFYVDIGGCRDGCGPPPPTEGAFVDNVNLTTMTSTTPLPGSLPLLASGVGLVGFWLRKRRQSLPTRQCAPDGRLVEVVDTPFRERPPRTAHERPRY